MIRHLNILAIVLFLLPIVSQAETIYKGVSPYGKMVEIPNPNKQLLPNPFPVYSNDDVVIINHPMPGFNKINIPVDNSYKKNPGCYIMCYSHQQGLYKAAKDIYAQGMVRVAGTYDNNRICQPTGDEQQVISAMQKYKDLCNHKIKNCTNDCWAGGDTGGWYGMQLNP
ncbi:hypothetical protein FOG18_00290 [Legionella israelensis]|uniref:hypothetical protein n=1 Tax=Legionella israelensis TaxID=454 RepID=UPI001180A968|nr:hypothetical protein [Legionella israelensis]QDP71132.1 hypothetical protein FOG18_00290 [Legionella israelensis]